MLTATRRRRRHRRTAVVGNVAQRACSSARWCSAASSLIAVPMLTHSKPLTVLTGSMKGTYDPGSIVVVHPIKPADLKVGDTLTYQIRSDEPEVITHRVVAISFGPDGKRRFITRGDANGANDPAPVKDGPGARHRVVPRAAGRLRLDRADADAPQPRAQAALRRPRELRRLAVRRRPARPPSLAWSRRLPDARTGYSSSPLMSRNVSGWVSREVRARPVAVPPDLQTADQPADVLHAHRPLVGRGAVVGRATPASPRRAPGRCRARRAARR